MSEDTSLLRKGLAGLAALVVAAASLAVLPQPAHTAADDFPHAEGQECLDGCDKMKEMCCINNSDPIG